MKNVFRIFARDVRRLFKAPAALIVALALLVLPSLYTWYNVVGFWNPYDNTGNLRVCVVNEDTGGSSELTGQLDVGETIVSELAKNDQLDWVFVDRNQARKELETGQAYATFIIPSDFTEHLLSLTDGDYTAPTVIYQVNEKAGPVSPKITDVGATTLDETINSEFVKTVSNVAVQAIDDALGDIRDTNAKTSNAAVVRIKGARDDLEQAHGTLASMQQSLSGAIAKVTQAQVDMPAAKAEIAYAVELANSLASEIKSLEQEMNRFSQDNWPVVSQAITDVQNASTQAKQTTASLQSSLTAASARITASTAQAQAAVTQARAAAESLRTTANGMPDGTAKDALSQAASALTNECDTLDGLLADVSGIANRTEEAANTIADATSSADSSIQAAMNSLRNVTNTFFGTAIPAMSSGLLGASAALSSVSATAATQSVLIDQVDALLDQLAQVAYDAQEAITYTDGLITKAEGNLQNLETDIVAVFSSGLVSSIAEKYNLNAQDIADFMGSPTEVVTEQLYPLNAYGSAMAPLFMNLTFWIGAFMLIVIMKQEVDTEGLRGRVTLAQCYVGRFLLFACMVIFQALICVAGVLYIGVEAASAVALAFAAAVASLAYLSIIYALSVTMQHVGKGICILLVFAQIPGATGLYPVEMTAPFFQALYPFLPFTYGIEAMRESICGFYGLMYVHDLFMLAIFFAAAFALGLGVRPLITNVNRMVAHQVEKSGVFAGEKAEVPPRPFRFSQAIQILANREDYRARLEQRYQRFSRVYPRFIRTSIILSVAVPVVLILVFALSPAEKVVILTIWLVWMLVMLLALVVLESMRSSFQRQFRLNDLSDESIVKMAASNRDSAHDSMNISSDADNSKNATVSRNASAIASRNVSALQQANGAQDTDSKSNVPKTRQSPLNGGDFDE